METSPAAPEIPRVAAPWTLRGQGYIATYARSPEWLDRHGFSPPPLADSRRGRLAYVMFVDYAQSNVGPYRELLFIPGSFQFGEARHFSITKIYVSSWESVVNGQANWGIPKEHADFEVTYGATGRDRVAVRTASGEPVAELEFQHWGFRLPVTTRVVPGALRTLAQTSEETEFTYTPEASGHVRPATLVSSRFQAERFPDLAAGPSPACVQVTEFEMVFPVSRERPARAGL